MTGFTDSSNGTDPFLSFLTTLLSELELDPGSVGPPMYDGPMDHQHETIIQSVFTTARRTHVAERKIESMQTLRSLGMDDPERLTVNNTTTLEADSQTVDSDTGDRYVDSDLQDDGYWSPPTTILIDGVTFPVNRYDGLDPVTTRCLACGKATPESLALRDTPPRDEHNSRRCFTCGCPVPEGRIMRSAVPSHNRSPILPGGSCTPPPEMPLTLAEEKRLLASHLQFVVGAINFVARGDLCYKFTFSVPMPLSKFVDPTIDYLCEIAKEITAQFGTEGEFDGRPIFGDAEVVRKTSAEIFNYLASKFKLPE